MSRSVSVLLSLLALSTAAALLTTNGCNGNNSKVTFTTGKIQHIVIIFQENRTPDNLFQDPVLINAGADIARSGMNSSGQTIPLSPISLGNDYDLSHAHSAFVAMYDNGKMDGADKITVACDKNATDCPLPNAQFMYVNPSDVQPYFTMAEQYTFGDRMFQTNEGPSFPAHQFIISGTSAPTATSTSFISENAGGVPGAGSDTGCTSPPAEIVSVIDPSGNENSTMYPCADHPTLTDELDTAGLSWKYYAPSAGSLWTSPNAIQHICGPNAAPPNATACVGSEWTNHVVLTTQQNQAPILADISSGQLPAVSWVIPKGQNSDHAGGLSNTGGPSWVASIVNAIGSSSYWANTAIIVTWDDWGGWYDHVPPPKVVNDGTSWGSGYVYGFRVPLIVISPYAKAAYISHVNHDFGSILNLIEDNFGLQSLGYADGATTDNLSDCFNFNQTPLVFQPISAPMNAADFLNDRTPITDPDDD